MTFTAPLVAAKTVELLLLLERDQLTAFLFKPSIPEANKLPEHYRRADCPENAGEKHPTYRHPKERKRTQQITKSDRATPLELSEPGKSVSNAKLSLWRQLQQQPYSTRIREATLSLRNSEKSSWIGLGKVKIIVVTCFWNS